MRIALNGLCADNRSGTGYYTRGLLSGLADLSKQSGFDVQFLAFVPKSLLIKSGGGEQPWTTVTIDAHNAIARILWEQTVLPRKARAWKADVLHGPAFITPPSWRGPSIVTIHDCAFLRHPETITSLKRAWYREAIPRSARRASLVLTDSEAARRDIIELLGIPEEKVRAIPLGVDARFNKSNITSDDIDRVRQKYELPERFILFVGVIEPRKNLATLVNAFGKASEQGLDMDLVIAGRAGWGVNVSELTSPRSRVLGFVEDADMPALYAGASLFAYPSLYEGFGLPVLEAMAAGVPVIVSDAGALVELAGEAGVIVQAREVNAWAEALLQLSGEAGLQNVNRHRGMDRAASYTWELTARLTLDAYRDSVR